MGLSTSIGNLAGSRRHRDRWTKIKHCQTQINQKKGWFTKRCDPIFWKSPGLDEIWSIFVFRLSNWDRGCRINMWTYRKESYGRNGSAMVDWRRRGPTLLLRSIYTSNDWDAYWQSHMRRERILLNRKKFEAIGYPDDYYNEDWGYERLTGT